MRFDRFDLNLLVSLDALLSERSVTRAAERVFLSQSSMSWTLARLREYFEDQLLVPSGRTMILTPFAHTLVGPVQELLIQARGLLARRPELAIDRVQRMLRVVASDHITATIIEEAFRIAAIEAPELSLDLRSIVDFTPEMLDSGGVDLVCGAQNVLSDRHPSEPLVIDRFVGMAWLGNTQLGERISPEQYQAASHVVTRWRGGKVATIDHAALRALGLSRPEAIVVPDFNMVPGFVVGTDRMATLPARLAAVLMRHWPVRIVELDFQLPEIRIRMQWHRLQTDDAIVSWLRAKLRQVADAPIPEMPS